MQYINPLSGIPSLKLNKVEQPFSLFRLGIDTLIANILHPTVLVCDDPPRITALTLPACCCALVPAADIDISIYIRCRRSGCRKKLLLLSIDGTGWRYQTYGWTADRYIDPAPLEAASITSVFVTHISRWFEKKLVDVTCRSNVFAYAIRSYTENGFGEFAGKSLYSSCLYRK